MSRESRDQHRFHPGWVCEAERAQRLVRRLDQVVSLRDETKAAAGGRCEVLHLCRVKQLDGSLERRACTLRSAVGILGRGAKQLGEPVAPAASLLLYCLRMS